MRVTLVRTIHADPARVFMHFSSPRLYAAAHPACRSLSYRIDSETTATTEEVWAYEGRSYRLRHRVQLEPPLAVALDTIDGAGRGARERVRLRAVPRGTRVSYEIEFSLPFGLRVLEPVVAARLRQLVAQLADEDSVAVERGRGGPARARPSALHRRRRAAETAT